MISKNIQEEDHKGKIRERIIMKIQKVVNQFQTESKKITKPTFPVIQVHAK